MRFRRRLILMVATAFVLGLSMAALFEAHRHGSEAVGGGSTFALALQFAVGVGLWTAGVAIGLRRRAWVLGALMGAGGIAVLLAELPLPESGAASLFTAALLGGAAATPLAGAAALFYDRPFRWAPDGAVAAVALVATGLWLGVLGTATFDPRRNGCFACPHNLLLVGGSPDLHDDLVRGGLGAAAASCAALALLALVRWIERRGRSRWIGATVSLGGLTAAAAAAIAFAHDARTGFVVLDRQTHILWLAQCVALGLVAAGTAVDLVRARLLCHRIAGIVIDAIPSSEGLRSTLAASVGDPTLSVAFPRGDGSMIDGEGRPVDQLGPDRAVTEVIRGNELVAYIHHGVELVHRPERLAEAARGAGLALEHASSRARLRAQLDALQSSRARLVEVGDAERQRLERNLHDGAQQRLIAFSVALQEALNGGGAITRARDETLTALHELRSLAHGIHPASLTDAGLEAALRELAEGSRVPVQIDSVPRERFPSAVESAAYRLALDAVRCSERAGDGRPVSVTIENSRQALRTHVGLPGVDAGVASLDLAHAFDRLAALDGHASLLAENGRTLVSATLPCES